MKFNDLVSRYREAEHAKFSAEEALAQSIKDYGEFWGWDIKSHFRYVLRDGYIEVYYTDKKRKPQVRRVELEDAVIVNGTIS